MGFNDHAQAVLLGKADPRLLQAHRGDLPAAQRLHALLVSAGIDPLDLLAVEEAVEHLQHGEMRAVERTDRDRVVLEMLGLVDVGRWVDTDGAVSQRRSYL